MALGRAEGIGTSSFIPHLKYKVETSQNQICGVSSSYENSTVGVGSSYLRNVGHATFIPVWNNLLYLNVIIFLMKIFLKAYHVVYHSFFLRFFSLFISWSEIYCKWHLQIHAGPDNFWHETHKTPSGEANHKFKFHKKAIHRGLKTLYLSTLE